jgi:uncharacterized YkwD family protein
MKERLKLLALSCTLSIVLLVSCGQNVGGVQSSIEGDGDIRKIKITSNLANIRTGCSTNSPVLQQTPKNTKLDVVGRVEDWYAVKLPNNEIGFMQQTECTPVVTGQQKQPGNQTEQGKGTAAGNNQAKIPTGTDANKTGLTADEQEMVRLVNEARSQNNLPALEVDMELTNVARIKSQDMIDNNYFSHNSPTYGSPFEMMKDFGVEYVKAGENIAGNQSVQNAHDSLMNSPGHRKNILSPDYTHVGIGIKKGGSYGNMFTQMFVSKPQ